MGKAKAEKEAAEVEEKPSDDEKKPSASRDEDEEEMLRKALKLSQEEEEERKQIEQLENAALKQALRESREEAERRAQLVDEDDAAFEEVSKISLLAMSPEAFRADFDARAKRKQTKPRLRNKKLQLQEAEENLAKSNAVEDAAAKATTKMEDGRVQTADIQALNLHFEFRFMSISHSI